MKIEKAIEEVTKFQEIISQNIPEMAFEIEVVEQYDNPATPFKKWFRQVVPREGANQKSGMYLIAEPDGTILYIGKAGSDNLGAEIWGKFSAAQNVDENDNPTFSKSKLAEWAKDDHHKTMIQEGNVLIQAITVTPNEHASLLEVYLQTLCKLTEGELPARNFRIG